MGLFIWFIKPTSVLKKLSIFGGTLSQKENGAVCFNYTSVKNGENEIDVAVSLNNVFRSSGMKTVVGME